MTEVICIRQSQEHLTEKTRVAAYCRVSSLPQEESYTAQVEHFESTIAAHNGWELYKVYGDEGVTGLNTIKRKGFQKMLADGKKGKYDLLLVKSISRLGRNTVDLLSSVRALRAAGVVCFFEKENISTDASVGELMLTLLSAFAQMESESISQNVRIGLNYKMQRGEWSVAYSNFLGYDRTPEGEVVINLVQAETVRCIFEWFLSGMGLGQIVKRLVKEKRTTGSGGLGWNKESVRRILLNRKYSGDVVLQMTITEDLITKHRVVNNGQAPQYVVIDGIPPIISRQVYYLAQGELERRGHMIYHSGEKFIGPDVTSYKNGFTGKMKCSCGANYNRVNVKKAYAWKCYNRIHGECKSEMIKEKELEAVVLKAAQELYDGAPKIEFCKVPVLSEESTPAEKMEAAAVYMENMFLKRVQTFAEGARPSEYSMDLLDMIELITLTDSFHVRFYTGQIITVDRIAVRAEKPQESQIETVSETVTYFGLTGEPRKRLAQRLAALTGEKLVYLGFPSMAFKVGDLVVKRDGTVEGRLSKKVLKGLERSGFYVVGREA